MNRSSVSGGAEFERSAIIVIHVELPPSACGRSGWRCGLRLIFQILYRYIFSLRAVPSQHPGWCHHGFQNPHGMRNFVESTFLIVQGVAVGSYPAEGLSFCSIHPTQGTNWLSIFSVGYYSGNDHLKTSES